MDDDQQFCLRWNNHQSTLVSVFDTLLEKGIHVDCTLAAEGQTLKAHKVVLSACSPYFENVLSQQYDKHPIIILKDVKYAELRAMMDYMYRGEVNISQDQLAALLKAAESLQIKGLSDNKPSRPPSRPAQAAPAHPPRAPSPPPQGRSGSAERRAGSLSPSRRRKVARRSLDAEPCSDPPPSEEAPPSRDTVEDLTIDEEHDQTPQHNDVVRNFQWHMERSQDELMNSNDSIRESQESSVIKCELKYAKTSIPITRSYLKKEKSPNRQIYQTLEIKTERKIKVKQEKKLSFKSSKRIGKKEGSLRKMKKDITVVVKQISKRGRKKKTAAERQGGEQDKKYVCSICNKRHYKYKRNRLRHEKYECNTGPQFACELCGKRYSQKKTLVFHLQHKHQPHQPHQPHRPP
ncbi:PREDICTED: zinc finger and BTB domain-containing protein 14 isoform X2 [Papilio polytes]|nr:PREDICTED: zinc finger and BTB domain-containing protein 14 isoform X2 [Papilio polytes]XP_013134524.1 PREDICTED: zinc finger and BTB domain-containing protein 14 isoform X2 [Papilio polytes]